MNEERRPSSIAPVTLGFALLLAQGVVACGSAAAGDENVATRGARRPTFDEWAAVSTVRYGDAYVVEGDMMFTREQAKAYYEATVSSEGALWSYADGAGGISKFPEAAQRDITWCIDRVAFTRDEALRLEEFAHQAMGAWEAVANVHFRQQALPDCEGSSALVRIGLMFEWQAHVAWASPPNDVRRLMIKKSTLAKSSQYMLAVMLHELGHSLGFGHEHDRTSDATQCADIVGCGQFLTPRDTSSVMFYANAMSGYTGTPEAGGGYNYITQWDLEGAQRVYGAPTDVVNTDDGTVFARKRGSGDFYRRDVGGWTRIGGPGRAFFTVGAALYGQSPVHGRANRYVAGDSWQTLPGGDNAQLFRCGTAVCATDPNTQAVARFDGVSWTAIGGAGLRFSTTESLLWAIRPHQEGVVSWTAASGWSYMGAGPASRELAGGGTTMYRIPTETYAVVQRWDAGGWTTLGRTFPRLHQVHATGSDVYVVDGGYGVVWKWNGADWERIDLAPFVVFERLHGSYGRLFATTADGTIYQHTGAGATSTWTSFGKP